jgi:WD40 repeat protein
VATGAETARLEGHTNSVQALCLLPDGRLASGSYDNTIRLWNVATGAETDCLEGHTDWVRALCLLRDGRLASGSDDKTIRLWNVATGAETARLELDAPVGALAAIAPNRLVAGDSVGRLHWLEVLD